jgi:hypothetical protein
MDSSISMNLYTMVLSIYSKSTVPGRHVQATLIYTPYAIIALIGVITLIYTRSSFDLSPGLSQNPTAFPPDIRQPTLWEDMRDRKLADDAKKIPSVWLPDLAAYDVGSQGSIAGKFISSLLDDETLLITSVDVPELMNLTTGGAMSAEDLVRAFCKRAAIAHQLVVPPPPMHQSEAHT